MKDQLVYLFHRIAVENPTPSDFKLPTVNADQSSAQKLLQIIFGLAAAVAILIIMIAAFNIVTGGGDPDKIARGKKAIIYSLVGLAIVVSADTIVLLVLGGL